MNKRILMMMMMMMMTGFGPQLLDYFFNPMVSKRFDSTALVHFSTTTALLSSLFF